MSSNEPSIAGIAAARQVIPECFRDSPQYLAAELSSALDCRIVLKVETQNPIRSFKGRGAEFLLSRTYSKDLFVCASAGNFGQGLAYAAHRRGMRAVVFVPEGANPLKLKMMRELGAEVIIAGADFDAAKSAAREYAAAYDGEFIEDGSNPEITEGAGTIGAELCEWPEPLDIVACPVGNGALMNGIGLWMKHYSPQTQVFGVCAAEAPAMALSWQSGSPICAPCSTLADGVAVREPVGQALTVMNRVVDKMLLVEEDAIIDAMRLVYRSAGHVVEPAGVIGVAAVLSFPRHFKGKLVAVPLCGANVTEEQMGEWHRGAGPATRKTSQYRANSPYSTGAAE